MRIALVVASVAFAGCTLPNLTLPDGGGDASGLLDLTQFDFSTCVADPAAKAAPGVTHPIPGLVAATPRELVVAGHSSTNFDPAMLDEFNRTYNARVRILRLGDAGETLNKMILERQSPPADLLYGVDNSLVARAHRWDLFEPYRPQSAANVPACLAFDPTWRVTPLDYGFVDINYDRAWMEENGRTPPSTLEDLVKPEWRGLLVVENPATSSPGLAFLLATIAKFGETGNATAWDYWRDLRANDVAIADGWEAAYYTHFTRYGGDRPLVVSYTTSPPAEVFYGDDPDAAEAPTASLPAPGSAYVQIEAIGVLRHAREPALAKAFVEFALSKRFQETIPTSMWVYPANAQAETPPVFAHATRPVAPSVLHPATVNANQAEWVDLWTDRMAG